MANNKRLFAQFTMINFLQGSHGKRTTQEILEHVRDNTEWGHMRLKRGGPQQSLDQAFNGDAWLSAGSMLYHIQTVGGVVRVTHHGEAADAAGDAPVEHPPGAQVLHLGAHEGAPLAGLHVLEVGEDEGLSVELYFQSVAKL